MRFAPVFLLAAVAACSAGTVTDTFAQQQVNCNYSHSAPYSSCDVIGDPLNYDIQKAAIVTGANGFTTITVYTNLNGVSGGSLGPFSDAGVQLIPGDIFFYAPANDAAVTGLVSSLTNPSALETYLTYGVALYAHNGLKAGDLFLVSGAETAGQALSTGDYIRTNLPVLMTGGVSRASGSGVTVTSNGNGTAAAEYAISVSFAAPTGTDFRTWADSGQIGLLYSSTDCGNDWIQGVVNVSTATPEPSSFALMIGGGVLVAGSAFSRRLRRTAEK